MSGISSSVAFSVTQIETTFADDLGNAKGGTGSGFWLELNSGKEVFVTNRHNVDPTVLFGSDTTLKLQGLRLCLRQFERIPQSDQIRHSPGTKFFPVDDCPIYASGSSDCAIIVPQFKEDTAPYEILTIIRQPDLADQTFFREKLEMMDLASFIGFPGRRGIPWWDEVMGLPIARIASIASYPGVDFKNRGIKTADVVLVSGLSFTGSSGSPVISHEKSIKLGKGLINPAYVPPMVIGIMSGHWWDEAETPEMFRHSGLSYLTRSTSILHLITANNL